MSVLESCFPHYEIGSQDYNDFWAQDDLSYQYFRIQFDPVQYIVLFIVEIVVFCLYMLSSARLFFIVALMLKVRFLVRARTGACSNCKIVYTLNYWPFQCAMCGGHFCKVCANQSRLLVGETTRSMLNLVVDFFAPHMRVANTASTAHEARVCNTCYGVFPAVTSTGETDEDGMAEKMWSSVVDAWSQTYGNIFDDEGTYGMRCARPETKKRRIAERVLKNAMRRKYGLYWRAGLKGCDLDIIYLPKHFVRILLTICDLHDIVLTSSISI